MSRFMEPRNPRETVKNPNRKREIEEYMKAYNLEKVPIDLPNGRKGFTFRRKDL